MPEVVIVSYKTKAQTDTNFIDFIICVLVQHKQIFALF